MIRFVSGKTVRRGNNVGMRMNCGIWCVGRLLGMTGAGGLDILAQLEGLVQRRGLSIAALQDVLQAYGLRVRAFRGDPLPQSQPHLVYDRFHRHFLLVRGCRGRRVLLSDVRLGDFFVYRALWRLWRPYAAVVIAEVSMV